MAKSIVSFVTVDEFYNTRLDEIDQRVYNRIESAYRRILGKKTDAFLQKYGSCTLYKMSLNKAVDISKCFTVI